MVDGPSPPPAGAVATVSVSGVRTRVALPTPSSAATLLRAALAGELCPGLGERPPTRGPRKPPSCSSQTAASSSANLSGTAGEGPQLASSAVPPNPTLGGGMNADCSSGPPPALAPPEEREEAAAAQRKAYTLSHVTHAACVTRKSGYTRKPKTETLNPKPGTRNPKPQTLKAHSTTYVRRVEERVTPNPRTQNSNLRP